jgi:DNA-directed RNA polymerase subunit RPC12/RpoP
MDQTEFLCNNCGSPHVSIPSILTPISEIACGRCGTSMGIWEDFCRAISLAVSADGRGARISADPVRHADGAAR